MSEETEWKTIRVGAVEYYKLVELSGMLTTIYGVKVAISTIATVAINLCHDDLYNRYKEILQDEEKILQNREHYRSIRLKDARLKLNSNQLIQDLELIKDRERDD